MIRIAIVDDDAEDAVRLREYLERYQQERGETLRVTVFTDGEDLVQNYRVEYDILLLDVEMRFMDGMTTAGEIRKIDPQVVIIFITNMAQYAIKGYTVDALDYVLKPVGYFAFTQRIDRALTRMARRADRFLVINLKNETRKLDTARIWYVEVRDHRLIYHTGGEVITAPGTMKDVESSLEGGGFFRCGKGYLVNLEHVEGFRNECAVIHGELVPVSRARKKEFLNKLNDYINEVSK